MNKFWVFLFLASALIYSSCSGEQEGDTDKDTKVAMANVDGNTTSAKTSNVANIPVYDFKSFEPRLYLNNDTTYVVNFWATWCKPCVAELPYFEKLHENYLNQKLKVLLVSLDFSTQIEKKLIPFIEKRQLKSEVVVLDDPDANSWIDQVDKKWSGAIPATIVYKGDKRGFFEKSFESYEELVGVMEAVVK